VLIFLTELALTTPIFLAETALTALTILAKLALTILIFPTGLVLRSYCNILTFATELVFTEPVKVSRKTIQLLKNSFIYRIALTVELLLFFFVAIVMVHPAEYIWGAPMYFKLPVTSLILIIIVNDAMAGKLILQFYLFILFLFLQMNLCEFKKTSVGKLQNVDGPTMPGTPRFNLISLTLTNASSRLTPRPPPQKESH
jgi:hypothetical protein